METASEAFATVMRVSLEVIAVKLFRLKVVRIIVLVVVVVLMVLAAVTMAGLVSRALKLLLKLKSVHNCATITENAAKVSALAILVGWETLVKHPFLVPTTALHRDLVKTETAVVTRALLALTVH